MNCEHEVRFTIKPTDDACRFHFDVRTYKDRIVAPDEYSGATTVTPSDDTQTLPTKDKTVRSDITVLPAPTEPLATNENGTFTPSDGAVGFSEVTVDIVPALDSLTVTENGLYLPESGVDGYDRVSVDVPWPSGSMTITENGTYDVAGYASAVVDVNVVPDLRPLSVSENGQYSPDGFDGYSDVTVDVEPALESLSVTENGLYLPESGVDGFDRVNVNVPDQYLVKEWTEESENLAFCNYWTGKIPNRDESNYNYILLFYGNTHANGVQLLIYGLQPNGDVIAVRFNNFRVIDNLKPNDSNIYALYVSAGTRVMLFKIPKITS